MDSIAKYYAFWIKSSPFDIGHTTKNAFKDFLRIPPNVIYNDITNNINTVSYGK